MSRIMKNAALCSLILTILFIVVYHQSQQSIWFSLSITFGTIAYHLLMRLTVGLLYNLKLNNHVDYTKPWFRQRAFEPKLYKLLHIKSWKWKVPTYDPDRFDPHQYTWDEIAQVMCQSELVHETIAILSFLPLLASIWFDSFLVFLLTSLFSAIFDLMFVVVQRYNRPRVTRLAEKAARSRQKPVST